MDLGLYVTHAPIGSRRTVLTRPSQTAFSRALIHLEARVECSTTFLAQQSAYFVQQPARLYTKSS